MNKEQKVTRIALLKKEVARMESEIKTAEKWGHESALKFIQDRKRQIASSQAKLSMLEGSC